MTVLRRTRHKRQLQCLELPGNLMYSAISPLVIFEWGIFSLKLKFFHVLLGLLCIYPFMFLRLPVNSVCQDATLAVHHSVIYFDLPASNVPNRASKWAFQTWHFKFSFTVSRSAWLTAIALYGKCRRMLDAIKPFSQDV